MSNLPGFLRRTLRVSFDDSGDEEVEGEHGVSGGGEDRHGNIHEETSTSTTDTAPHETLSAERNNSNEESSSSEVDWTPRRAPSNRQQTQQQQSLQQPQRSQQQQPATAAPPVPPQAPPQKALSTESSTSSSSAQPPPPKSYREVQFDKVMSAPVVNLEELRKLSWNGIPTSYRGTCWKMLLGYLPTNQARRATLLQRKRADYKDAIAQHYDIDDHARTAQEQETLRQVLVDVPRTAPDVPLFRNDRIRRLLTRLLYIWAMRHPASSYVQGINDLATPLLVVFLSCDYYDGQDVLDGHVMNQLSDDQLHELEADIYGCLTNLLAGIQDHYTSDQPGVQRMVMRLEELVNRIDGDLCAHFRETGVEFIQFAFKWMNCLLLREFRLVPCVVRLWDTYLSETQSLSAKSLDYGFEGFHVYVCAAFVCQFSAQLQTKSFDELFAFLQAIPTDDWGHQEIEMLLSQAYVLSTLFGGSDAHLTSTNPRSSASATTTIQNGT